MPKHVPVPEGVLLVDIFVIVTALSAAGQGVVVGAIFTRSKTLMRHRSFLIAQGA